MITLDDISKSVNCELNPLAMFDFQLQRKRKTASLIQNRISSLEESFAAVSIDNGTVFCLGEINKYQHEFKQWQGLRSISLGEKRIVGLKCDGTLVAAGRSDNLYNQCYVSRISDATEISCTRNRNFYLSKGILYRTKKENKYDPEEYCEAEYDHLYNRLEGIVQIATSGFCWAVLRADGTVFSHLSLSRINEENITEKWNGIVQIACSENAVFGLKQDGTVVFESKEEKELSSIRDWHDIVSIAARDYGGAIGLRSDGTVTDMKNWKNIVAISGGDYFYAIDNNGLLYTTNSKIRSGKYTVPVFNNIESVEQDIAEANKNSIIRLNRARENREKGLCQYCGGVFSGFLFKKCSNCGRSKNY